MGKHNNGVPHDVPPNGGTQGLTLKPLANAALTDQETAQGHLRPALKAWCEQVVAGVHKGERTAMNLYAKAMKIAGAEFELTINVAVEREFGMTLNDLRQRLTMVESVEDIDETQAITAMELHLREFYRKKGMAVLIVKDEEVAA